jgi:hypothetical protein
MNCETNNNNASVFSGLDMDMSFSLQQLSSIGMSKRSRGREL